MVIINSSVDYLVAEAGADRYPADSPHETGVKFAFDYHVVD